MYTYIRIRIQIRIFPIRIFICICTLVCFVVCALICASSYNNTLGQIRTKEPVCSRLPLSVFCLCCSACFLCLLRSVLPPGVGLPFSVALRLVASFLLSPPVPVLLACLCCGPLWMVVAHSMQLESSLFPLEDLVFGALLPIQ